MSPMILALLLSASPGWSDGASSSAQASPSLHWVRIEEPGDYWIWGVLKPNGAVRPAEYSSRRPAFETNGVLAEKLTSEGPRIRASDAGTLADARRAIEGSRSRGTDVGDDDASEAPCLPDPSNVFRDVERGIFWTEALAYFLPALFLAALAVVVLAAASRIPRPPV